MSVYIPECCLYVNISVLMCDRDCRRVIICITPLDFALPPFNQILVGASAVVALQASEAVLEEAVGIQATMGAVKKLIWTWIQTRTTVSFGSCREWT